MKKRGGGIVEAMSMMMMIQVDFGSEQILDSRSMCPKTDFSKLERTSKEPRVHNCSYELLKVQKSCHANALFA